MSPVSQTLLLLNYYIPDRNCGDASAGSDTFPTTPPHDPILADVDNLEFAYVSSLHDGYANVRAEMDKTSFLAEPSARIR